MGVRVAGADGAVPVDRGGKLVLWCAGVELQVVEDSEVALDDDGALLELGDERCHRLLILFQLFVQGFAGFGNLSAMVDVLDGLFEAYGDAKTEDDGGDEEVAPGVGGVARWVDVEHGSGSAIWR